MGNFQGLSEMMHTCARRLIIEKFQILQNMKHFLTNWKLTSECESQYVLFIIFMVYVYVCFAVN